MLGLVKRTIESQGDPAWDAFAREYNAAHPDGNAGERVAEWVENICQVINSEEAWR